MTDARERALLADFATVCARIHAGFEETGVLVSRLLPITADALDRLSTGDETMILAYLKRFEQFEDALGRLLKAVARIMEHGKVERMTSVDVARRAHALGILGDEEIWAEAVRTRNALAHEYPLDAGKRASQVNRAWAARETLIVTWTSVRRFIEEEGLSDGTD